MLGVRCRAHPCRMLLPSERPPSGPGWRTEQLAQSVRLRRCVFVAAPGSWVSCCSHMGRWGSPHRRDVKPRIMDRAAASSRTDSARLGLDQGNQRGLKAVLQLARRPRYGRNASLLPSVPVIDLPASSRAICDANCAQVRPSLARIRIPGRSAAFGGGPTPQPHRAEARQMMGAGSSPARPKKLAILDGSLFFCVTADRRASVDARHSVSRTQLSGSIQ